MIKFVFDDVQAASVLSQIVVMDGVKSRAFK